MFDWFDAKKRFSNIQNASDLKINKSSKIQYLSCGCENYSHYKVCLGCGAKICESGIPEMPKDSRMDISGSVVNVSSVGGNSTITINGKFFQVPGKANVSVKNGKIFINGESLIDFTRHTQPISIEWNGEPPSNLEVFGDVVIYGNVSGNVNGNNVKCCDVGGNIIANNDIQCSNVNGNAEAGGYITCDSVGGDVKAGGEVQCDGVGGNIEASGDVTCNGNVSGDISADGHISCKDVGGNVESGVDGDIKCGDVSGNIDAGGNVSVRRG